MHSYIIKMYMFDSLFTFNAILENNNKHKYELMDNIKHFNFHKIDDKLVATVDMYKFNRVKSKPNLTDLYKKYIYIYKTILYLDDQNIIHYVYIPDNDIFPIMMYSR